MEKCNFLRKLRKKQNFLVLRRVSGGHKAYRDESHSHLQQLFPDWKLSVMLLCNETVKTMLRQKPVTENFLIYHFKIMFEYAEVNEETSMNTNLFAKLFYYLCDVHKTAFVTVNTWNLHKPP